MAAYDLIIKGGRNYHPQDIEQATQEASAPKPVTKGARPKSPAKG